MFQRRKGLKVKPQNLQNEFNAKFINGLLRIILMFLSEEYENFIQLHQ